MKYEIIKNVFGFWDVWQINPQCIGNQIMNSQEFETLSEAKDFVSGFVNPETVEVTIFKGI